MEDKTKNDIIIDSPKSVFVLYLILSSNFLVNLLVVEHKKS